MYRHPKTPSVAFPGPTTARRAFTLVELLVVITIIAMLVGLLVPAAMMARSAARRTQCINNQRNLGQGILQYQTAKMKFPPLLSVQPGSDPMNPTAVGWVPPILPYIEQNPLYQVFQNNQWHTAQSAYVEVLVCPAASPGGTAAPLSYVVNSGTADIFTNNASKPMDLQANGLFFDNFVKPYQQASQMNNSIRSAPISDLAYVSNHDGTTVTLMLSENLDAVEWVRLNTTSLYAPPERPTYTHNNPVQTWWQSLTWQVPVPAMPNPMTWGQEAFPTGQRLNKNVGAGPPFDFTTAGSYNNLNNARPSSNHSGGFIVTMADGSSRFVSEEIQYRVYCLLMSPDSANAKDPAFDNPPGNPFVYPSGWYQANDPTLPLKPVLENEIF